MSEITKLTFVGDIMCKADMVDRYGDENGNYDFSGVFEGMKKYFAGSDFVLGNLETPISMDGAGLTKEKYSFNTPYQFAIAAHEAGIDFVATANNHCLDRGIRGIDSTIKSLNKVGLLHTGVFSNREKAPMVIEVNGLKIGIMAYTYGTNAFANGNYLKKSDYWRVNLFQNQELSNPLTRWSFNHAKTLPAKIYNKTVKFLVPSNRGRAVYERREFSFRCKRKLLKEIRHMRLQKPDIMIMYMHAGGQYNPVETDETKKLSSFLIRNGIDIVAGSHEHVVHGGNFENISNNKIETYSLGNFCGVAGVCDEPFDKMAEYSIALNCYISVADKKIQKATYSILKTVPDGNKGIKTVPVYELMKELTTEEARTKLLLDTLEIAKRFSGNATTPNNSVLEEYDIDSSVPL